MIVDATRKYIYSESDNKIIGPGRDIDRPNKK